MTEDKFLKKAKFYIFDNFASIPKAAKHYGITPEYFRRALKGEGVLPSALTDALGFDRKVIPKKIFYTRKPK